MVLHQTFKWSKTNPSVPKQQLVWNSKICNIKKNENRLAPFLRERNKVSLPLFLPLCLCVSVSLCLSPAVIDLTQLQLKQKKNEVDAQKAAQQMLALKSPPLLPERQQGLAASPGSAGTWHLGSLG